VALDVGVEAETPALMWTRQAVGGALEAQTSGNVADSQHWPARQDTYYFI
jgi:hypothetical protein